MRVKDSTRDMHHCRPPLPPPLVQTCFARMPPRIPAESNAHSTLPIFDFLLPCVYFTRRRLKCSGKAAKLVQQPEIGRWIRLLALGALGRYRSMQSPPCWPTLIAAAASATAQHRVASRAQTTYVKYFKIHSRY